MPILELLHSRHTIMRKLNYFLLLSSVLHQILAAEDPRPRGVGPEFAKYYKPGVPFACISHPSITIPEAQINDDYCDCPDGSDEPGTSACSYISPYSPTYVSDVSGNDPNIYNALPGFYCKNKGHQPSYVPFISVNDGVCDHEVCCDGSDEWARVGGKICENKCKEIGKEWKRNDEQRQKSLGQAAKRRKELVVEAAKLRQEIEDRIKTLGVEIDASAIKVKDLQAALTETEKSEKGRVLKGPGKASKIAVLAGLAKDRVEELRGALIEVWGQRDAAREKVTKLEAILSAFKEDYNPNFNDEGVKRTVRSWEEYAAQEKIGDLVDACRDLDLDEITKSDAESGAIQWSEWEDAEESDVEVLYKIEEYLPKPVRDWFDQKLRDLRVLLVDNGIVAGSNDPLGSESKAVTTARAALKSAEDDLQTLKDQLMAHKSDLETDYGQDDVFRALKGQCVSKDSGEYTYEHCWLDRTKQKSKKGGSETGMGNFVRIDSISVDEEVAPDGRGLGSGTRVVLRYENGQHCWNGPNRRTLVVLACAEKDEVWKVVEEEKCVYRLEAGTPAVCGIEVKEKMEVKDEL